MGDVYFTAAVGLWLAWMISWWAAAWWRARASAEAPRGAWRGPFMLAALGFFLVFWRSPRMPGPLWPVGPALGWSMVGLTALALCFAWWARVTMGRMWSGGVTRTEGHTVIERGPFAVVRHPIYTALIAAGLALAVIQARPTALAGWALFTLGFYLKARVEERFLTEQLSGYPEYRARVPMLVPFAPL